MASRRGRPASSWKGNEGGHYNLEGQWRPDPTIDVRKGVYQGRPSSWRNEGPDRQPLPPMYPSLITIGSNSLAILFNLVLPLMFGFIWTTLPAILISAWFVRRGMRQRTAVIAKRNAVRELNLNWVEDWIIQTDLPPSSPGLAEREAELERLYEAATVKDRLTEQTERQRNREAPTMMQMKAAGTGCTCSVCEQPHDYLGRSHEAV